MTKLPKEALNPELIGTSEFSDAYHHYLAAARITSDPQTMRYMEAFFFLGVETCFELLGLAQDIAERQPDGTGADEFTKMYGRLRGELRDRHQEQLAVVVNHLKNWKPK